MTINQDSVKNDWKSRGFTCDLWTDPPGQSWENFVHDTDELLMIVSGKLEVIIDNKPHYPEEGEEVLIPKGAMHSVKNIGDQPCEWLYGYEVPHD